MSNKVVIITAPSGAGKTTIVHALLEKYPTLEFSVSACTRPQRPGEEDGSDYYFHTKEGFLQKIYNDEFLEWEEVYEGSYYGTLKSEVDRLWDSDKVIMFDVDVKGAKNLKRIFQEKALAIFIKPPSLEVLDKRLKSRKSENEDSLKYRMKRAEMELDYEDQFDTVIINDDLNKAIAEATEKVENFISNKNFESRF